MKLHSTIIFLLLSAGVIYSQDTFLLDNDAPYKVELFVKFLCDSTIAKLDYYILSREGSNYTSEQGYCFVPQIGQYEVKNFGINDFEKYFINVQKKNNLDTLIKYKLNISRGPGIPGWPYYSYCEKRCNGIVTDYWENGRIRITGKFKNGDIKEFNQYNKNGQLVLVRKDHILSSLYEIYEGGKLQLKLKRILIFGSCRVWDPETKRYIKSEYYQLKN